MWLELNASKNASCLRQGRVSRCNHLWVGLHCNQEVRFQHVWIYLSELDQKQPWVIIAMKSGQHGWWLECICRVQANRASLGPWVCCNHIFWLQYRHTLSVAYILVPSRDNKQMITVLTFKVGYAFVLLGYWKVTLRECFLCNLHHSKEKQRILALVCKTGVSILLTLLELRSCFPLVMNDGCWIIEHLEARLMSCSNDHFYHSLTLAVPHSF